MSKSIAASLVDARIAEKLNKFGIALRKGGSLEASLTALDDAIRTNDQVRSVRVTIHMPTCRIRIGKLTVAKEILDSSAGDFVEKNGTTTTVVCFPGIVQSVHNLSSKLRWFKSKCSVGNSDYMDLDTYQSEFLPKFVEYRNALNELKKDLWEEYEDLVKDFSKGVNNLCNQISISSQEQDRIDNSLKYITSRDKNEFFNSISFELLSDFNADLINEKELREVAREAQKMRTASLLEELILGSISDVFDTVCSYYKNISLVQRDDLSSCDKSKGKLLKKGKQIRLGNIGNAELLNKIGDKIIELAQENDKYEGLTLAYYLMAELLGIARDLEIDLDVKNIPSELSQDILLREYVIRKKNNKCFF